MSDVVHGFSGGNAISAGTPHDNSSYPAAEPFPEAAHLPAPVWEAVTVDSEGCISAASEQFATLFGFNPQDMQGKDVSALFGRNALMARPAAINVQAMLEDAISLIDLPDGMLIESHVRLHVFRGIAAPIAACLHWLIAGALAFRNRDEGRIMIHCEQSGDHCVFTVHDDGAALAPTSVLDADTGLSAARRVAGEHGGSLEIRTLVGDRGLMARLMWPLHTDRRNAA